MDRGNLHGVRVFRGAPAVSHTDDSFFFFWADIDEVRTMKRIFETYAAASGQSINFGKLRIFYSRNTDSMLQEAISSILGVFNPLNTGRYLGMPSLVGKGRREVFNFLRIVFGSAFNREEGNQFRKGGVKF